MTTSSSVFVFNDTSSTRFNDKKPKPVRCISFQYYEMAIIISHHSCLKLVWFNLAYILKKNSQLAKYVIIVKQVKLTWKSMNEVRGGGGICLSVCLSVCLCRFVSAHNFFLVWHWFTLFGIWGYHHDTKCRVYSWSRYDLELWPQSQIYRGFDMFSCPVHNFLGVWHWLTIFGTWVNHHETMCRVHSWSRYNLDLWPQGQIYRLLGHIRLLLSCLHVRPVTSVCFDIGISYLTHGSITMRGCVKYIHDTVTTLTFDPKVKLIGFMSWVCVQASAFFVLW